MERQYFTATDLGSYFHLSCQLALWKTFHQKPGDKSPGQKFEKSIINRLDELGLVLKFSSKQSLESQIANDPRDHLYVIGSSFKDDALFRDQYHARGVLPVSFGRFKPDFIEIWKRLVNGKLIFEWHVIDAKSTKSVKASHHVQVFFYWRALQEILPSNIFVPCPTASIWLPDEDAPTPFIPATLKPQMETFLFTTLPKIVNLPFAEVPWHFNSLCDTCQWRSSCRQRTEQEGTVSMIPDLSIEKAEFLREVIQLARPNLEATEIEDLDRLALSDLHPVDIMYPTTARRFRSILGIKRDEFGPSPVLEAIKTREIKVLDKPTFQFPRDEDYSVIISLVTNPGSLSTSSGLMAFEITVFHGNVLNSELSAQSSENVEDNFIFSLSRILSSIISKGPAVRTQLYCFSPEDISAINEIIVYKALSDSFQDSEELRICIGAVVDIPLVLLTSLTPELLENALYRSWTKAPRHQLERHLSDLSLSTTGTVNELRDRLQGAMTSGNPSPRKLPKIVCLHQTMQKLLAIPSTGYTTLQDCANGLFGHCLIPGDDEIYSLAKGNQEDMLKIKLRARGMTIHRIITGLRELLATHCQGNLSRLLPNEGQPLSPAYPQLCRDLNLRKLIFLHEYEVLLKLRELWNDRIDQSRPVTVLEFIGSAEHDSWSSRFKILEGGTDLDTSGDFRLFEWMLCRMNTDGQAELLFDDLAYHNCFFPNTHAAAKWSTQPKTVLENLSLADPITINVQNGNTTTITLQLFKSSDFTLNPGDTFRLLPRYVDFNLPKILRNFLEIEVSSPNNAKSVFMKLLENPTEIGRTLVGDIPVFEKEGKRLHSLYQELSSRLGNLDAKQLVFQPSQRRAMQSILKRQATIIWGPPGSGKTHTLALSMVHLLEILYRTTTDKVVVWMTAVTNAAIDIFLRKFLFLCDRVRSIPDLSAEWLDALTIRRIDGRVNRSFPQSRLSLAAGTVWQLWKYHDLQSHTPTVLIIDEAGQMNVGTAALVMRWLDDNGRLIVAGDHLQLAPILKGVYPKSEKALFGSILHCLIQSSALPSPVHSDTLSQSSDSDILYQLEENFRMNKQLCNFVELIYQKKFRPLRSEIVNMGLSISEYLRRTPQPLSEVRQFLQGMSDVMLSGMSTVMKFPHDDKNKRREAKTMFLMNLKSTFDAFTAEELHIGAEAKMVAELVRDLATAFAEETIFVVTPHRVQRRLVTKELSSYGLSLRTRDESASRIWVDTTERMQGSEADIVICLLSHTHAPSLRRDLNFLYNRPRLNVAISRAKTISIVISSTGVLAPPIEALVDKGNLEGFAYLKAFEDRAWRFDMRIGVQDMPVAPEISKGPQFSSQDYDDSSWEAAVQGTLDPRQVQSQLSTNSSTYDDPELDSLFQHMRLD